MTPPRLLSKRKRWIAAGVLWLLVAYPLSAPAVAYAYGRGWIGRPMGHVASKLYVPAQVVMGCIGLFPDWSMLLWESQKLGERHAAPS